MHLMRRGKMSAWPDRICSCCPQGLHVRPLTRPAETELMRPAVAAEEAVRHTRQQCVALDREVHRISLRASG
jgi:hypothetical protein